MCSSSQPDKATLPVLPSSPSASPGMANRTSPKLASHGTMSYANAGTDTTPAGVCTGTFAVGKKLNFQP
jgi:hypothetical protein